MEASGDLLLTGLLALNFVAWGAHVTLPWSLADRPGQRHWTRLGALVLLWVLGLAAFFQHLALYPDHAVAAGLGTLPSGSAISVAASGALLLLAILDITLLVARSSMSRTSWRFVAILAATAALLLAGLGELLRANIGPFHGWAPFAVAAVARLAVLVAAGELVVPDRPKIAPFAALGLIVYWWALPPGLRQAFGDLAGPSYLVTLGAAAVLLAASRWVPIRLRRITLAGGIGLSALLMASAERLSEAVSHLGY